jgi:hypothetical protein
MAEPRLRRGSYIPRSVRARHRRPERYERTSSRGEVGWAP